MENSNQKNYTFHIHGMHCNACVILTENELKEHPKVLSAKSSLKNCSVEICGNFGDMTLQDIAKELTNALSKHSLSIEEQKRKVNWEEFILAIPVALGFAFLFVLLQKLGIVNLGNTDNVTYGAAFVIGIIASLSTCMTVVGGLLLSTSATFAQRGDKVWPQVIFHLSRLIIFFILGGVIGAIGATFQLGSMGIFIIGIITGLVMLALGINLLDVFNFTKRLQPSIPKFISQKTLNATKINHALTPALVGIATFFLPCGFTQSMQTYTLSTSSFLEGGLVMFSFALGTLPVLALVSFSSLAIQNNFKAGIFFKSAGLIVILFAIFNIINSLVAIGWISPVFNF